MKGAVMDAGDSLKAGKCGRRYDQRKAIGTPGWTGEYVSKQDNIERVLARNRVQPNGRFLELGCGAGNMTLYMAGKGFEAYGVDVVPQAIEWAREKMRESNLLADFRAGSVADLSPYPDDFFDVVYDGDCLWMVIGPDRKACMAGVFRILKPGGLFFARAHLVNDRITERFHITPNVYFDPVRRVSTMDEVPMYYFSKEDEFRSEITEAGFVIRLFETTPAEGQDEPFMAGDMSVDAVKPMR